MTAPASAPTNRPTAKSVLLTTAPGTTTGGLPGVTVTVGAVLPPPDISAAMSSGTAPMISAVSGSSTENPNVPSTCDGHGREGGRLARSAAVTAIRITAGIQNSSARLRPSVARVVIQATVGLNKPDMGSRSF